MQRCRKCQQEYDDHITFCPNDGQLLSAFDFEHLIGKVIDNRYRLDAKLGEGAHGVVYRALQLNIDRTVALKILHPSKVLQPALMSQIVDVRDYWLSCLARFRREARAAGRILHPNVVAVTGFGTVEGDIAYLVMEYLEGVSLRNLLKTKGALDILTTLRIMRQVAWAIECAHREGVIHRDLKPANIFLEQVPGMDEVVKVLDFGIAKLTDSVDTELTSLTDTGILLGTPRYMSPEQCGGRDIGPPSDIYSLGVILYEMLVGEAPFIGPTMAVAIAHETRQPRSIAERLPDLATEVTELVMNCLKKNPTQRPQTAGEVAITIEDILLKLTNRAPLLPPQPISRTSRIEVQLDFKKAAPEVSVEPEVPVEAVEKSTGVDTLPDTEQPVFSKLELPTLAASEESVVTVKETEVKTPMAQPLPQVESENTTQIRPTPSEPREVFHPLPKSAGTSKIPGDWPKPDAIIFPTIVVPPSIKVPKGMTYIPEGYFRMGCNTGLPNERPAHLIFLNAFFIDLTEVTNAQYRLFCDRTKRQYPAGPRTDPGYFLDKPEYPVMNVSWEDAFAYATWAGKRLPTEAEWEKAARGGLEGKLYPWGDDITPGHANYGLQRPARVGTYFPNGYGLYDVTGNVWEWCADWYDEKYYEKSPAVNPQGPTEGRERVLRGGSTEGGKASLRVSFRHWMLPTARSSDIGFRCAQSLS